MSRVRGIARTQRLVLVLPRSSSRAHSCVSRVYIRRVNARAFTARARRRHVLGTMQYVWRCMTKSVYLCLLVVSGRKACTREPLQDKNRTDHGCAGCRWWVEIMVDYEQHIAHSPRPPSSAFGCLCSLTPTLV